MSTVAQFVVWALLLALRGAAESPPAPLRGPAAVAAEATLAAVSDEAGTSAASPAAAPTVLEG
eukprot:CAMPEP_0195072000 /NCGR_PEP_ID=MMETSP0448-20130528/15670_1 /TAXON_ID=66468 /ORGANISM="Heterocapsa triquestra, Strain CCMP 448" /LENGTH=62 /DNA_ID=CAMNT_0040103923 /DNA_START=88 /DNA_END=272 /DNA_ORIENTATION=-